LVADDVRPAAIKAGVKIETSQRFGPRKLRPSFSKGNNEV